MMLSLLAYGCTETIEEDVITNYEECIAAGNPSLESYPALCVHNNETFFEEITDDPFLNERGCVDASGTWLSEFNECEYISEETCEGLGGIFSECASACRNDPAAEICTMQCVQVCSFE